MTIKKSFERPQTGVYYLIPDPKSNKYTILSAFDEPGKGSLHLFLWKEAHAILSRRFKNADDLEDAYTSIPRGRIIERNNEWVVAHGDDVPLATYRGDILSEFSLNDANAIGKVHWEVDAHEKMNAREKKMAEKTLGITYTAEGFSTQKGPNKK